MAPLEFSNVLYVPALCSNLFSVLYLTLHRSFTVCIEKDTMHFIRDNRIAFQAKTGASKAAFLVGDTIPIEEFASLSSATTLPLEWHLWHHHLSQQNGVAERSNRTIEEGVVSMLCEFGMPTVFWGKALATFIHTSKRSFTPALPEMTPHEASPRASQICPCFVLGAVLLMCLFRVRSGHLVALEHTWRSVSLLDTLQVTRAGSSTILDARRWLFQKELTLMSTFSCSRGTLSPPPSPSS